MVLLATAAMAVTGLAFFACSHQLGGDGAPAQGGTAYGRPSGFSSFGLANARDHDDGLPDLAQGEELVILERGAPQPRRDDEPGTGAMLARIAERDVPMPLAHTAVKARVRGHLASVDVTQRFHNPYSGKIEAVYVFPLPHDAGVREFVMTVGERRIRGVIREREQAEQIYREARARGHVASLLREERPNVFTQKVANLEPGARVDVAFRYLHAVAHRDGWFEWTFPMVVGPRFNPPHLQGDGLAGASGGGGGIGAVGRGQHGSSGQAVEVQYLKDGERTGHDVALAVELDAGVPIERLECRSHEITTQRPAASCARVELAARDRLANRDFVLRYAVAGDRTQATMFASQNGDGGFFSVLLFPPRLLADLPRQPLELVLVLDCSGSMDGEPIAQARAAVHEALDRLEPQDAFQIVRFSDEATGLGRDLVPATRANRERAHAYVDGLRSEGGTMMDRGIAAALAFPREARRLRIVAFLTDGFIGNDPEILAMVAARIGDARLFSFGVGAAPNRFLLEGMARLGRGAAAFLEPGVDGARVMERFLARATRPALCQLELRTEQGELADVQPERLPDLFAGMPVAITGRYRGAAPPRLRLAGRVGGEPVELPVVATTLVGDGAADDTLPVAWARAKIESLGDAALRGERNAARVRALALEFGLVSAFTSFLAVDCGTITAGTHGTTVPVAVPVPAGASYETTVGR